MAKHLNAILKGYSDVIAGKKPASEVKALTTGKLPGVDYAGKMPDERDFVASHSVEKHADRNGNGDDVFNGSKVKMTDSGRHGHIPSPKDSNLYTQTNEEVKKDEGEYGYEGDMAINQLKTICRNAEHLAKMLKPDTDLPEWVQSKITKAEDYISSIHNYLMSEMNEEKEDDDGWYAHREIHGNKGVSKEDWKKGYRLNSKGEKVMTKKSSEKKQVKLEAKMCESCGKSPCQCDDGEDMPKGKTKGKKLLLGAKKALQEKAESVAQQKLMAMALAYKRGDMPEASAEVKKLASSMTEKQLRDFAATKHEGLPKKVQKESAPAVTPITFPVTNSREGFKL